MPAWNLALMPSFQNGKSRIFGIIWSIWPCSGNSVFACVLFASSPSIQMLSVGVSDFFSRDVSLHERPGKTGYIVRGQLE